jgi:hypothetical protein
VSAADQNKLLRKLLLNSGGNKRLVAALVILGIGITLLLISVMAWWNFRLLLSEDKQGGNSTNSYIVIGKQITEHKMAASAGNTFSNNEMEALVHAPQVLDAGEITPALFPVYAVIGGNLSMATDLPLEGVPDRFLDEVPEDWSWRPGDRNLPIILSSQFFDIYNYVFAPGQGLPQLSRASVKSIGLKLKVGGKGGQTILAHVSGFSDRIGSVLAPQSFIEYGNKAYANAANSHRPSQIILKVKDPSDTKFTAYLQDHGYTTNPQQLKWSKMRSIVVTIAGTTGMLALLLIGISGLVFTLFIELTITRAQASLTLLRQLGYSGGYLRAYVTRQFLPMILITMAVSMVFCLSIQFAFSKIAGKSGLLLPQAPGWPVWLALGICLVLLSAMVRKSVKKAIG